MKFAYTILYVDSVAETLTFYDKAFGFSKKMITPEEDYGELVCGDTTLSFASHKLGESNFNKGYQKSTRNKPLGFELAFTTENIDSDFEKAIKNGATLVSSIEEKPWGQKVGYVQDLNGFIIEICTPIQ